MKTRFEDKYFSVMGDSISTFEGCLPADYPTFYDRFTSYQSGILGYRETWWGRVITHFGGKLLVNNSWSGSYVCRPAGCEIESYGCSDARCGGLSQDGVLPDHILVYLGTNDRGAGFWPVSQSKTDLSVIENAYGVMLDKLKQNYPAAEIWCCTFPITTCLRDPSFVFPVLHMGRPMEDYGRLVAAVAKSRGCHVIDLWDPEVLCDTLDGLHPTYAGMEMIARKVIAAMEEDSNG